MLITINHPLIELVRMILEHKLESYLELSRRERTQDQSTLHNSDIFGIRGGQIGTATRKEVEAAESHCLAG